MTAVVVLVEYIGDRQRLTPKSSEAFLIPTQGTMLVIPIVGDIEESVRKWSDSLKLKGYDVYVLLNEIPIEKSIQRAVSRSLTTEQYADPEIILPQGNGSTYVYNSLLNTTKEGDYDAIKGFLHLSNDIGFGEQPIFIDEYYVSQGAVPEALQRYGNRGRESAGRDDTTGQGQEEILIEKVTTRPGGFSLPENDSGFSMRAPSTIEDAVLGAEIGNRRRQAPLDSSARARV